MSTSAKVEAAEIDLSIIVVSWNTAEMLDRCLRSIEAAPSNPQLEVIVVDNASTDDSRDLVTERHPEALLIRNSDNRGFGPAVNQGLVHARGRHLLLLNSDTVVHGDVLAQTVQYLDEHPDVGALGCAVRDEHGHLQPTCFREPSVLNAALQLTGLSKLERPWAGRERLAGWRRDDERDVEVVTGCYLAVPRRVVDEVGLLDEAYLFYGEETDWCRRMRLAGWRVRFAPIGEIVHVGGASAERLDHYREILLAAAKVRFVTKHRGQVAGWAEFGLLWAVALSRVLGWTAVAALRRTRAARRRRDHFVRVVRDFGAVRPALRGGIVPLAPTTRVANNAIHLAEPTIQAGEAEIDGYVCFSAQDWWYFSEGHSDFQLMKRVAREKPVLLVNSLGMRMPKPGGTSAPWSRIRRKIRSATRGLTAPLADVPGFHVFTPVFLPIYGRGLAGEAQPGLVLARCDARCVASASSRPAVVVTLPTAWPIARQLPRARTIVYRSDRYSALPEADGALVADLEREMLRPPTWLCSPAPRCSTTKAR